MKFCSGGEKMRNASGHLGENERQWKKSEQEHVRHFLQKTCNQEASGSFTLQSCKTTAKKCTKKVCCTCKVAFLLIRPIFVFSPFSLPSPLRITRFYILFEQTINIVGNFVFSPGLIYILQRPRMFSIIFSVQSLPNPPSPPNSLELILEVNSVSN